jgi:Rrf2 family protein
MTFSRASQYAIRALTYLATHYSSGLCPLEKIATEENIPQPFLGKILQKLAQKRIIRSAKGLNGGFGLAVPPGQITLYSVVNAIDDLSIKAFDCILGHTVCSEEAPCPLHNYWKEQRTRDLEFLNSVTLQDLSTINDANAFESIGRPQSGAEL